MWRFAALFGLWLALPAASFAQTLDLKNVRLSFGPQGATRTENKFLPGDYLFMTYDIEGLKFDDKTGKSNYKTTLEVWDSNKKKIFQKDTPNEVTAQLGGTRMPGDLHVITGREQPPGKYIVRLIVVDMLTKNFKHFDYTYELLPKGFGIVGVAAPAVGFPGQQYLAVFHLADMGLDAKKQPNVEITMKILDKTGTAPVARPIYLSFPNDLPADADLQKANFVPVNFPIYLNRAGQFTIEVDAVDKVANKTAKLRYPLHVVDITEFAGK